jgi:hypothetical protein
LKRCFAITTAVLLSLTNGQHCAVLQSVAWTTMLVERTHEGSLITALTTTFDGQHPCKLCRLVRAGKGSEQKSEAVVKLAKLDSLLPSRSTLLPTPPATESFPLLPAMILIVRSEAPPLPPPRA